MRSSEKYGDFKQPRGADPADDPDGGAEAEGTQAAAFDADPDADPDADAGRSGVERTPISVFDLHSGATFQVQFRRVCMRRSEGAGLRVGWVCAGGIGGFGGFGR